MTIQSQWGRAFFTKYDVEASHFVYDSTGGVSSDTGWIDAKADKIIIQSRVATYNSGKSLVFRVEGKFDAVDRPASIYTKVIASSQNVDTFYSVPEIVKSYRVGVKLQDQISSPLGSPCLFYAGICVTEVK